MLLSSVALSMFFAVAHELGFTAEAEADEDSGLSACAG